MFFINLLIFILIFILWRKVNNLEDAIEQGRLINDSDKKERILTSTVNDDEDKKEALTDSDEAPLPPEDYEKSAYRKPAGFSAFDDFLDWLKDDWMLKVGGFLLLLAFGWFVKFAFDNNWIGPIGRIALGLVSGTGILSLGWWRMQKFARQGSVFLVLGSTVVLITTFAARELYGFFNVQVALGLMFLSTAFVALASVRFKARYLSLISLALAAVVPLFAGGTPDQTTLFVYLLTVVLGALWIVAITGWRELTFASLLVTIAYSVGGLAAYGTEELNTLLILSYVFTVIFFIANIAAMLKIDYGKNEDMLADILTAGLNGLFILSWIIYAAEDEWKSLLIAGWMIIFSTGAFIVSKAMDRKEPFFVYAGISLAMLATATALELSGDALTIAYLFEALVIILLAHFITGSKKITYSLLPLLLPSIVLSMENVFGYPWGEGTINKDSAILLVFALVLAGLGYFLKNLGIPNSENEALTDTYQKGLGTLFVVGVGYLSVISVAAMASSAWRFGALHEDLFVLLAFIALIVGIANLLKGKESLEDGDLKLDSQGISAGLYIVSSVYAYILVWLVFHSELTGALPTMLSLVVYTIVGISVYVKGANKSNKFLMVYGGSLLALVVGRLLIVDLWDMETGGRVITFFLVGGLLMSTAFLGKGKIQDSLENTINYNENEKSDE
ncbi:MAG: DUF2339 domain-containing protein [Candidatus Spechtbacterales bacterium]|nr:DUF2339 domain-containing protein [Candidatus Spechtbacterales bacterium]